MVPAAQCELALPGGAGATVPSSKGGSEAPSKSKSNSNSDGPFGAGRGRAMPGAQGPVTVPGATAGPPGGNGREETSDIAAPMDRTTFPRVVGETAMAMRTKAGNAVAAAMVHPRRRTQP